MNITQPEHTLLLQSHQAIDKQAVWFVSIGYVVEANHDLIDAQEAWPWLLKYFKNEPMDMVLKKQHGTFALAGKAYAQPFGSATEKMAIHAQLGQLEKTLYVFGNRHWEQGLTGWKISEPQPFFEMPVDLEHAFSPTSTPLQVGSPLPNIELPSQLIHSPTDCPTAATFRALAVGAPEKQRWLGRVDEAWQQQHFPWLPIDTDPHWFDGVPADQTQPAYWQGNENWSVTGMNAEQHTVSGTLPALRPRLLVQQLSTDGVNATRISEARLDLDTVWLFPNEQRVLLWYRAAVSVAREDAVDVSALAIFTEYGSSSPSTLEQLEAKWLELEPIQDEAAETLPPPAVAALSAEAIAFQESLITDIQNTFNTEISAVNQTLDSMNTQVGIHIPQIEPVDLSATDVSALNVTSTLDTNAFEQQLRHEIDNAIQQGIDQADEALEKLAHQLNLDPQEFKNLIQAAKNAPNSTPDNIQALLAQAPISEELRQSILSQIEQAERQEQSIKKQLDAHTPILNVSFQKGTLNNADFSGAILNGCDFSQAELTGANFTGAQVMHCNFNGAQLTASTWTGADISHSDFSCVVLNNANMTQTTFSMCQFHQSQMQALCLSHSTFDQCVLNKAVLRQAELSSVTVMQSQFHQTDLTQVHWPDARVSMQSDFSRALLTLANLQGASLQDSTFTGANFSECNLSDAFIKNCVLDQSHGSFLIAKNASLQDTSLCDIQWRGVNLMRAAFVHCVLTDSDLRNSNLFEVEARTAKINRVFLEGALLTRSVLAKYKGNT